jgi:hypothetical protein
MASTTIQEIHGALARKRAGRLPSELAESYALMTGEWE